MQRLSSRNNMMADRFNRSGMLSRCSLIALATCSLAVASPGFAQTLPVLGPGVGADGGATITTAANAMSVDLNNASRVITWTSYNIGNIGETVNYSATNAVTPYAVLNRVLPGAPSQIQGMISAQPNINVWIVNPDGITFSPTGGFNGAGLVLSTLDVSSDANFLLGTSTGLAGASTAAVNLQSGAASILSSSGVVVVGQDVTVGKTISATGDVALVAARDVTFPMSLASPLGITINSGTTLATANVAANGTISGASVRVVGASEGGAIANLLGVSAAATLTATAVGGAVVIATKTDSTNGVTVSSAAGVDGVGVSGAVTGNAATGKISLTATGTATASGALSAGKIAIDANSLAVTSTTTSLDLSLATTGSDLVFPDTGTYNFTRDLTLKTTGAFDVLTAATLTSPGALTINSGRDVVGDSLNATGLTTVAAARDVIGQAAGRMAIAALGAGNNIIVSAGGQAKLGAITTDAAAGIAVTAAGLDISSTNSRDLSLTSTGGDLSFPGSAAYTVTRDLSLKTTGAFDVLTGTSVTAPRNLKIDSGKDIVGDSLTATSGSVTLTAAGAVGGQTGGRMDVKALAADQTVTLTATGNAKLGVLTAGTGATTLAADQIKVQAAALDLSSATAANGRIALTSTSAATGDILIGDFVTGKGNVTVTSARDVQIKPSDALVTTGFVRSTGGNVLIGATAGSVFGLADNTSLPTETGFGAVSATGATADVTISGTGDARIGSISAGRAISGGVTGSLTGLGSGSIGTNIIGGALQANGTGGTVTVNASNAVGGVAKLAQVSADQAVSISANQIAIGKATSTNSTVTLTPAVANGFYVGSFTQAGSIALTFNGLLAAIDPSSVTLTNVLESGFGRTALDSGTSINLTVGRNAQLSTTTSGTSTDITARGLAVTSATATNGALNLTANAGTLNLGTGSAKTSALIRKLGGTLVGVSLGDELRVTTSLTTTTGDATVNSNTSARLKQVTATDGNVVVDATLGDVTGLAGVSAGTSDAAFGRADLTANGSTRDVKVTAAGLAQLGTVSADRDVSVRGGNATTNGAVDITSATATNRSLSLTARAIAPVGTIADGDVIVGTGVAGTTAGLSNTATGGTAGNVVVRDQVRSGGTATLTSAKDVLIQPTDAGVTTGFVRSTGGDVMVTAGGSVFGLADNKSLPLQTGFGAVNATGPGGNVTISGTGDARIDSITASGSISGGVSGSLTGQSGSIGTSIVGGTLLANGAGGNVTVNASNTVGDVIKLAAVSANQNVSLTAHSIAVGKATSLSSGGNVLITPAGSGSFYVGLLTKSGPIALTFNGLLAANPSSITLDRTLESAFGKTALNAGSSVNLTIGRNAQLSTISAGTSATLDTRALTATSATTSNGALSLTAQSGTLDLGTGSATGGTATLTKLLGSAATPGDELRVASLSGTGAAATTVDSSTHVRLGLVSSSGASTSTVVTARSGDVTGLALASPGNSDPLFGRGDVTAITGGASVSAARLVQLGTVSSAGTTNIKAGDVGSNGAIDVTVANSTAGNVIVSALAVTPTTGVYDGRILLDSVAAGTSISLSNVDRSGNSGDILVANAITAGQDVQVDAVRDAKLHAVTNPTPSLLGTLIIRSGRDTSTANVTMNEDVVVRAGRNASFGIIKAGDDIDIRAVGPVTLTRATTDGTGSDGFAALFNPLSLGFQFETTTGANISLVSTGSRVGVTQNLSAPNHIRVNAMGADATIGGDITSTVLGIIDVRAFTDANLLGNNDTTKRGDINVFAGSVATIAGNVVASDPTLLVPTNSAYAVTGTTGVVLGDGSARTQAATGAVTITATTGDVTQGGVIPGLLTLRSNTDLSSPGTGVDGIGVTATTGSVLLGNTDFVGGSTGGRESEVRLTAGGANGDVLAGTIDGDKVIVSAGRNVTFNRNVTGGSLSRSVDPATLLLGNQTIGISAGNNFLAQPTVVLRTLGAGHDIDIRAGGTAASTSLIDATGTVVTRTGGDIGFTRVSAGEDIAIRSNTGNVTLGDGSQMFDLTAGDDIDVTAGGAVSLTGAQTLATTGTDTRSVSFGAGLTAAYGAQATTGANIAVIAGTTATVSGDVTAGDAARATPLASGYTVQAGSGITLGDGALRLQQATGAVAIVTAAGDVQGSAQLTLQSNSDKTPAGTAVDPLGVTATTGSVLMGTTSLVGGSVANRESEVRLTAGGATGDVVTGKIDGDRVIVSAARDVTLNATVTAGSLVRAADSGVLAFGNQSLQVSAGRDFLAQPGVTLTTLGTGHDIDIRAGGTATATGAINATGMFVTRADGAINFARLRAGEDIAIRSNSGTVTLGDASQPFDLVAGDDIDVSAPNGSVSLTSAQTLATTGTDTRSVSFAGAGLFAAYGAQTTTGANIALAAGTTATITREVRAGDFTRIIPLASSYSVQAGTGVTLGDAAARQQWATGALTIATTTGDVTQGSGLLVLNSNSDRTNPGLGTDRLGVTANAGSVLLGNTSLVGGSIAARESEVRLTAAGTPTSDVRAGRIDGDKVLVSAVRDVVFNRDVNAGSAARGADGAVLAFGNQSIGVSAGRDLVANNRKLTTFGTGHDIDIRAGGTATATELTATGTIVTRAGGDIGYARLSAGEDIAIRSNGGNVTLGDGSLTFDVTAGDDFDVTASTGSVSLTSATTTGLGADTRSVGFTGNALAAAYGAQPTTGANIGIVAGTTATITRDVTAANNYTVDAVTGIALGDATSRTQKAGGLIRIASSGTGDVTQGSALLTLQSNSDQNPAGTGVDMLSVSASNGSILLGNTDFVGGSVAGRESDVRLSAAGATTADVVTGKIDGDKAVVSAVRDVTFNRDVTAGSLARGADGAVLALGNQSVGVSAGGNFVGQTVKTLGAGHDIDVRVGGTAGAPLLDATGTIVTRAGGDIGYSQLRAGEDIAIRSNGGNLTLGDGTQSFDVQAGDDIDVTAGGAISLTSATTTGLGADARSVAFTGNALAAAFGAQPTTGANIALAAGTTATVTRNVTASGSYSVDAVTGIALGGATARTQSAGGLVRIANSGAGDVTQGSALLTLRSNADLSAAGTGLDALTVSAAQGSLSLGNTDFVGGSVAGREAEVRLTAAGTPASDVFTGKVDGDKVIVSAARDVTFNRAVTGGSTARGVDPATLAFGNQTIGVSAGGNVSALTLTTLGAGHDLDIRAGGTATAIGAVDATGTIVTRAGGNVDFVRVKAGEDIAIRSNGGNVKLGDGSQLFDVQAGDDIDVTAAGSVLLTSATTTGAGADARSVAFTGSALAATYGAQSTTAANIVLDAGTTATVSRAVDAAGSYAVTGGTGVVLGDAIARTQSAKGALTIVATTGDVTQGSALLTLRSNSDLTPAGTGADALSVTATTGNIAFANTDFVGGGVAGRESDVRLTATGATRDITTGKIDGDKVIVSAGRGVTFNRDVTAGSLVRGPDSLVATDPQTVDIRAATVNFGTVKALGTGHDVDIVATGALSGTTLSGARNTSAVAATIGLDSGTAVSGNLLLRATGGDVVVGAASAGGTGTVDASANARVTGSLIAGGTATLTAGAQAATPLVRSTAADVLVRGATVDVGTADAKTSLAMTALNGDLKLDKGLAGTTATLATTLVAPATVRGDVLVTTSLLTSGATTIDSVGNAQIGQIKADTGDVRVTTYGNATGVGAGSADLEATAGKLTVTAGGGTAPAGALARLGAIKARNDLSVTADTLAVNTSATSTTAGVALTARTGDASVLSLSGVTASSVSAGRDALIGSAAASGGNLTVTATRDVSGLAAGGRANVSAGGAGSTLGVTATTGLARLGTLASGATTTVRAKVSFDLTSATAGGAVTFDTDGKATTGGAVTATGQTVNLIASDADIGGTVTANKIVVTNRSTSATNALRLGTGATGSGGFELTETEVNRLSANEVVLDAGTATGLTAQDIAIGALALATTTGSSRFDLLGTKRIDVTGAMKADGSAATRVVRLGGTTAATGRADTIAVAAAADGTGGRILMSSANLELRAVRIGVGQTLGFLNAVGLTSSTTPLTSAAVGAQFIGNPNSSLYNAAIGPGGLPYTPTTQATIAARTLTVQVTNYALFQNTAVAGLTGGAVLGGTSGAPINGALVVNGPNPPDAGGFALFGSINGISGSATSLLGPSVIGVTAVDRVNTRINGCIVGSGGGGCLVNVISQPTLTVFDNSRANVFKTAADFQIPFDPVVATNNESLFGDVGTFGLADIPVGPAPACVDPKDCPTAQEPRK